MNNCIACDGNVEQFFSLGNIPLANNLLTKSEASQPETFYPLKIGFCHACGFIQLLSPVDPSKMFQKYLYISGTNATLTHQLHALAAEATKNIPQNSLIIDIGSNDGTLLRSLKDQYTVIGIDPASNMVDLAAKNGVPTETAFFSSKTAEMMREKHGLAKVIIGSNVFAHTPTIRDFVQGVKILLNPDGIAVFESPYFVDLINGTQFDTIYHEHVAYLTVRPLVELFNSFDLQVFRLQRTPMHGGAIRVFVQHKKSGLLIENSVSELLQLEKAMGLHDISVYKSFSQKVHKIRTKLLALLFSLQAQGKTIAGYAAPAKATILLNYFGIGPEIISFLADKNPMKQGKFLPGKHIPIVDPEEIMKQSPDYLLILAWNVAEEIIEQQQEYRDRGGKFIIPLPEPTIL